MGGFNSGGCNSTGAATCESGHSIDLAWLRRARHAAAGSLFLADLVASGRATGSISLIAQHDGVRLRSQTKDRHGSPDDVNELAGLPEDLWRALFSVPSVLPPGIRLAERKGGSARLGPSSQDSQAPARQVGQVPTTAIARTCRAAFRFAQLPLN